MRRHDRYAVDCSQEDHSATLCYVNNNRQINFSKHHVPERAWLGNKQIADFGELSHSRSSTILATHPLKITPYDEQ